MQSAHTNRLPIFIVRRRWAHQTSPSAFPPAQGPGAGHAPQLQIDATAFIRSASASRSGSSSAPCATISIVVVDERHGGERERYRKVSEGTSHA